MTWTKQTKVTDEWDKLGNQGWGNNAWGSSPWGDDLTDTWDKVDKDSDSWTKI